MVCSVGNTRVQLDVLVREVGRRTYALKCKRKLSCTLWVNASTAVCRLGKQWNKELRGICSVTGVIADSNVNSCGVSTLHNRGSCAWISGVVRVISYGSRDGILYRKGRCSGNSRCLCNVDTRALGERNHGLARVDAVAKQAGVLGSVPVAAVPVLGLNLSANLLEVFGGNANKVIDVIDALACKISGVDIHAQSHVLAGKVWLILTASLVANINGVLPNLNSYAVLIVRSYKLRSAERAVRNGEVAVSEALRHDDIEHWLLKRVPVPVCVVDATRNLEGLAAVNLGLIDATNAVKNLRRAGLSGQRNACVRSGTGVVELDVSDNVGVSALLPRAVNAVGDVAPAVVLVSDMLVVWIPCIEKIAHWSNAIVSAKNWTKVNLDGSDGGIDIKAKGSVGDKCGDTRGTQNAWVSSSARAV